MQIVILAGGLGTRISKISNGLPKSLIKIFDKPFLSYQLDWLISNDCKNILMCVGHGGELIKNFISNNYKHVNIQFSDENKVLLGTGGALRKAIPYLDKKFILIYGDSFLRVDLNRFINFFKKHSSMSLMGVIRNKNKWDISNCYVNKNFIRIYEKDQQKRTKIKKNFFFIDYGISGLNKSDINLFEQDKFIDLSTLYSKLSKQDKLLAFKIKKRFYEIGSEKGIEDFKYFLKRNKNDFY